MIRTPAWSKGGIRRQVTRKNKDAAECQVKVNRLGSESKPENRHILFFFFFLSSRSFYVCSLGKKTDKGLVRRTDNEQVRFTKDPKPSPVW